MKKFLWAVLLAGVSATVLAGPVPASSPLGRSLMWQTVKAPGDAKYYRLELPACRKLVSVTDGFKVLTRPMRPTEEAEEYYFSQVMHYGQPLAVYVIRELPCPQP